MSNKMDLLEKKTNNKYKEMIFENNDKNNINLDLFISTINWNVSDKLQRCIDTVLKYSEGFNYEWSIIDNNSNGMDFNDIIHKYSKYSFIKFIKNPKNEGGFARDRFLDIKKINSRYILFLQPDVILKNNAIKKLIDFMDSHKNAGAATAKLLNLNGTPQEYFSKLPTLSTLFYVHTGLGRFLDKYLFSNKNRKMYFYSDLDLNKPHIIEQIGDICFIFRTNFIHEDGYFHELDLSFSMGDYDFCKRIYDRGFYIYLVPSAEVYHDVGSSYNKKKK